VSPTPAQHAQAARIAAAGLWQALARENPDTYQETYNRHLALLRRDHHLRGQEQASIWLHLDDSSDRNKPNHIPRTANLPEG
jgi:hypothetical protein